MNLYLAQEPKHNSERQAFPPVLKALDSLSDDYHVLLNINFPKECDALIFSPNSVVIVEIKAWASAVPLKSDGDEAGEDFFHAPRWRHDKPSDSKRNVKENPIQSVRDKANATGRRLKRVLGVDLPCYPVLVFPIWEDPPNVRWIEDKFGRLFFKGDLTDRFPEFVTEIAFDKANLRKFPHAKSYRLAEDVIRSQLVPESYRRLPGYKDGVLDAPASPPPSIPEIAEVRNNFQFAGPVTGDRFFGMGAPMKGIRSRVQGASHLYLAGMRRMGKTSLLRRAEELKGHGAVPYNRCEFLFLDFFSDVTTNESHTVYEAVLFEVARKLDLELDVPGGLKLSVGDPKLRENIRSCLTDPVKLGFDAGIQGTRDAFRSIFKSMLARFREKRPGWRVVLVLDEFSDVLLRAYRNRSRTDPSFGAKDREEGLISTEDIRCLMNLLKDTEVAKSCSTVVIGKPYMIEIDRQLKTELFSVMSQVKLDFLKRDEMESMVSRLASPVIFDPAALYLLWFYTQGHPFYVQLLCDTIISELEPDQKKVSQGEVTRAADLVIEDDAKFSFELTDYDLKTSDTDTRELERLSSAKLVACLAELCQSSMRSAVKTGKRTPWDAMWVQTEALVRECRKQMHLDERHIRKVLHGLTEARVLEAQTQGNQPETRFKVPLLQIWALGRKLFPQCKMLA